MAPANLKIWVIENFAKVEVPKEDYGKFFNGDSYIVLNEKKNCDGSVSWDLHMWIGDKSTQDEYGSCAILAVELDDELGGAPVQHRETQFNESSLFLGYFKPAITYKAGGLASGFRHVIPNDFSEIKRLLWVRGRHQVRVDEMPFEWASLNQSDCFIVDMGNDIHVWSGAKANHFEKLQTINVANSIKNNERGGKVKVSNLDSSTGALVKFLGSQQGKIADGAPEPATRSRSVAQGAGQRVELYKVSDVSGEMVTSLVAEASPFSQSMLESGDVYVVSNTRFNQIFVWKGKEASPAERKAAMKTAINFIDKFNLPKNAKITVVAEHGETALFKSLFSDWRSLNAQEGLGKTWSMNKIAKVAKVDFDVASLLEKPDLAAKYQLPDDGSGDVKVWRVEGSDKQPVAANGQLFGGDCYIIAYTYANARGRQQHILYYWIGAKATKDEVTALPILTIQADESMFRGAATQIRVTQGHEPPHMMMLFGGKPLVIFEGGTSRKGGQSAPSDTRLFHVKAGFMGSRTALEVNAESKNLNSNDAFVLITPSECYLWIGRGATDGEKAACAEVAGLLGAADSSEVEEGSEPAKFWDLLGGKCKYFSTPALEDEEMPLRLFECSDSTGNFTVEEVIGAWNQQDLNPDNVMLLDAWTAVYVWIGKDSSESEREEAASTAAKYVNLDVSARNSDTTPIYKIHQGKEPIMFSGFFQGWDDELWS